MSIVTKILKAVLVVALVGIMAYMVIVGLPAA